MQKSVFEVIDDSGYLAIVDPDAYEGFVREDWEIKELTDRFYDQMQTRRLLLWHTEMEFGWVIRVAFEPVSVIGFRERTGTVRSSTGRLLLTSYDGLTTVAMFHDQVLPSDFERKNILTVQPGLYSCRIIQLHDHSDFADDTDWMDQEVDHYVIEVLKTDTPVEPWQTIPWDQYLIPEQTH